MDLFDREFKRRFSLSVYKNLKVRLGEMTFFKDFVNDTRGDLYPLIKKSDDLEEYVRDNEYTVKKGSAERIFCQFFPYATYEMTFRPLSGKAGLCFNLPDTAAEISVYENAIRYTCGERTEKRDMPRLSEGKSTLIVSCRPGAFDIYFKNNGKPEYLYTFYEEGFRNSNLCSVFSNSYVALTLGDNASVTEVLSYIDSGISLADIRPIKYENGEPMTEQGRVYFTASVRLQEGSFQGIFSWIPGTAELQMTGALFYDSGDGRWRGYLAPVILYNRTEKKWYVWVSSFEHEHILAHAAFDGDPRFGVNVVDVTIMDKAPVASDISVFAGFKGDEDPDLIYDEGNGRWLLSVCRIDPKIRQYVYVFFESKHPFEGYKCIGKGRDGAETGGSFVKIGKDLFFVCGNDFNARSEYRIYGKNGMRKANFNYPDGGFRGWGTVVPVKLGSRTRYFWLTFDRHNGSEYNWSYGNLYCFEAD